MVAYIGAERRGATEGQRGAKDCHPHTHTQRQRGGPCVVAWPTWRAAPKGETRATRELDPALYVIFSPRFFTS